MTRAEVRRRLALEWWCWLSFALAPLFFLNLLFADRQAFGSALEISLFIAGAASMLISLPLFSAYKRGLIVIERALDSEAERGAWLALAQVRRNAFLGASLPAWIGAIALFTGLNAVALFLLAMSSSVLFSLYRIPRQLG